MQPALLYKEVRPARLHNTKLGIARTISAFKFPNNLIEQALGFSFAASTIIRVSQREAQAEQITV
ncbi:hypothetical protein ABTN10_19940, partial [Acinetobacter baumannii]